MQIARDGRRAEHKRRPAICSFHFAVFNFQCFSSLRFDIPDPSAYADGTGLYISTGACFSNFPTTSLCSGGANSSASCVTIGVVKKFSVGGGEAVCHSNPGKFHGFASAIRPDP